MPLLPLISNKDFLRNEVSLFRCSHDARTMLLTLFSQRPSLVHRYDLRVIENLARSQPATYKLTNNVEKKVSLLCRFVVFSSSGESSHALLVMLSHASVYLHERRLYANTKYFAESARIIQFGFDYLSHDACWIMGGFGFKVQGVDFGLCCAPGPLSYVPDS